MDADEIHRPRGSSSCLHTDLDYLYGSPPRHTHGTMCDVLRLFMLLLLWFAVLLPLYRHLHATKSPFRCPRKTPQHTTKSRPTPARLLSLFSMPKRDSSINACPNLTETTRRFPHFFCSYVKKRLLHHCLHKSERNNETFRALLFFARVQSTVPATSLASSIAGGGVYFFPLLAISTSVTSGDAGMPAFA